MGVIRFNGISSADFGCTIERRPNHTRGSRRGELIEVPGRNGAAVLEDGSFTTYKQEYVMAFKEGDTVPPYQRTAQVAEWLLGSRGFCRLEDDFEPNVYRMARYAGALNIEQVADEYGRVVLEFECQPQRFLKLGETEISVESSVDSGGLYIGTITMQGIPYGAKAFYADSPGGTASFVGEYKDANDNTIAQFYDTPVAVPDGAVNARLVWNNAQADTTLLIGMVDEDGNRTVLCGVTGTSPTVFNLTDYEARPLLKFVDTSEEPSPVAQTITRVERTAIASDGSVVSASALNYTCQPISVNGYVYAYVSGNSYAFYDSDGKVISFVGNYYKAKRVQMEDVQVVVPTGAAAIVVGTFDGMPEVAVSLKAARPNPGASAVTINGVTISLDFSLHETIYLDCDLHDAYYIDGSSANDKVTFSSNIDPYPTFPGFVPGENTVIVRDGNNLDFSIIPRWWTL